MIDQTWEQISQSNEIYKSSTDSSYLVKSNDNFEKFKKDYKRLIIYRNIIHF